MLKFRRNLTLRIKRTVIHRQLISLQGLRQVINTRTPILLQEIIPVGTILQRVLSLIYKALPRHVVLNLRDTALF